MILVKKIDIFILKKFFLLFAASFCCCQFVFMMQFTWRSIDDLIGKGLTVDVLAEFFGYMALALVPQALPLSLLLAALMTFGNMGQQLELLSLKAAGVPLFRSMAPVAIVAVLFCGLSFYFQNVTSPRAQLKLSTLLLSMKMNSPVLEIPEGSFYNGVPNINLYVDRKNNDSGMLYHLIIYKTDQGFDKAQIVRADSGRMEMTEDKQFLCLQLWSGEQFENLQEQNMGQKRATQPYDRETFSYKKLLISFDSKFSLTDESLLNDRPDTKNMAQLELDADSLNRFCDSVGRAIHKELDDLGMMRGKLGPKERKDPERFLPKGQKADFYADFGKMTAAQQQSALQRAMSSTQQMENTLDWERYNVRDAERERVRHILEWHRKIVLALSCIVFFFIAAPLGAIIQKGGFGLSITIAVIFFILYHLMSNSGMKLAREGHIDPWIGIWFCMAVLIPTAIFLSKKGNNDSFQFNPSATMQRIRRLLGLRTKRYIPLKEVIIEVPDYENDKEKLLDLERDCDKYIQNHRLWMAPNYFKVFFSLGNDEAVKDISRRMNIVIEDLSNSKDFRVIGNLNDFPVLYPHAHLRVTKKRGWNLLLGLFFPLGVVIWLRMWRFRLILLRDLKQTVLATRALCDNIQPLLEKQPIS